MQMLQTRLGGDVVNLSYNQEVRPSHVKRYTHGEPVGNYVDHPNTHLPSAHLYAQIPGRRPASRAERAPAPNGTAFCGLHSQPEGSPAG